MKIAERPRCSKCDRSMVKTKHGAFICYICHEWVCPADYIPDNKCGDVKGDKK